MRSLLCALVFVCIIASCCAVEAKNATFLEGIINNFSIFIGVSILIDFSVLIVTFVSDLRVRSVSGASLEVVINDQVKK